MRYELLKNDTVVEDGITLYRIKALEDFGNVKTGDIGGYVQSEYNLDNYCGDSWIYNDSKVFGNAYVTGSAEIRNAIVRSEEDYRESSLATVIIRGDAILDDNASGQKTEVCGNGIVIEGKSELRGAKIIGSVLIYDSPRIDDATIKGNVRVFGNAYIGGWNVCISDYVMVFDHADIRDSAEVFGRALIYDGAQIRDNAIIFGNARVCGGTEVEGDTIICENAILDDYRTIIREGIFTE